MVVQLVCRLARQISCSNSQFTNYLPATNVLCLSLKNIKGVFLWIRSYSGNVKAQNQNILVLCLVSTWIMECGWIDFCQ